KYVPPHLRKGPTNHGEQYLRLKRLIQGLLNRLGDANMESIFASIEKCFRENSRHDVNEILTDSIIAFVGDHANLLDSFVMTYAAFIASLYNVIGIEFAAHMVQTMTELIEQSRSQYLNAKANKIEGTVEINSKRCTNLVTLLAYLYNFGVISSILLFDVVRVTIDELSELDIELLLRILRISGFQIRADDPSALKDIVALVQEEVGKRDPASLSSRFKFMVETMMDLKNNKRKLQKKVVTGTDMTQQERLKKFVTNMAKKRNTFEREPLRVGLEDIRSIKTKGKWWLVGAAWAGHDGAGSNLPAGVDSKALTDETGQASSDLLKLARAQKMNTDVRRSIFIVLMSSEDCIDAFERLLKLNLKDKQEREIVRVLIHCCYQERVYNPYYSLVAQKICDHSHGFKITFQYALWDAFKAMVENAQEDEGDAMDVRKVSNLAKLYAHLIGAGSLTLAVLK
ncbi:armadillo-type protein, partial [Gaertneriomyces semiglobifer]